MPYLWIAKAVALAAAAALLLWGWHLFTEHYRDEGRAEIQAKWDADKAERLASMQEMQAKWALEKENTAEAIRERNNARAKATALAREAAKTIPEDVASQPVPSVAVGVLNDAIGNSAEASGPPGGTYKGVTAPPARADSTIGLLVDWGITAIDMYETCRARVVEWQQFYSGLQKAQPAAPDG